MALGSSPVERLMKILAIDTAGWNCSVALWEDNCELSFQEKQSERDQAALLPQCVRDVMGSHKIDQLVVNVGPGSFTGIRVGLAFAKGFSMGLGVPLKGMDGFTVGYASLGGDAPKDVIVLIDAHRQDIFGRRFLKGIPQLPHSLTRNDLEKILSAPHPPLFTGVNISSFLEGLSYNEAFSSWRGAQAIASAFFKNPTLAIDPFPFYVKNADVTYPKELCTLPH